MTQLRNELLHFSREPLREVRRPEAPQPTSVKPRGLWVSVGAAWLEWCHSENFHLSDLRTINRVELSESAKILRLSDAWDLDRFTDDYTGGERDGRDWNIDWMKVASLYDGIIIAPYCWERRHDLAWYYGWDVASGCIWNPEAIARIETTGDLFNLSQPTMRTV